MNRVLFFGGSRDSLTIPQKKSGNKVDKSPLSASNKTAATDEDEFSDHVRQEKSPSRLIEAIEEESIDTIYALDAPIVSSSKKKKYNSRTRSVSFSEANIVYFPMELGDNPSCRNGLPIQLGQEAVDMESIDVDLYEKIKSRSHIRSHDEMRMSFMQRRLILKRQHSKKELDTLLKEMNKDRQRQRRALRLYRLRLRIMEFLSCRCK